MQKKNVAVIFGGCSPEYGVSLESASSVIKNMDSDKYNPIPIGISPEGAWFRFYGDTDKIANGAWLGSSECAVAVLSANRAKPGLIVFNKESYTEEKVDVAFPVMHGKFGEDGTIQGLIELAGIPLVGCNTMSSALCMDKDRAHALVRASGISVPASFVFNKNTDIGRIKARADIIGYPLFVKPVRAGSSFGVSRIINREELLAAIELAFEYDEEVVIEENIKGFEVGCAIIGNEELIIGEVDEIELSGGFFDFSEKYTLKTSAIHVPARIPEVKAEQIKSIARIIYRVLGCRGFARVDMFLTDAGEIVFNEVNTIPGFTAHSRFPNMLKMVGMNFKEVISKAIELAVEK